MTKTITVFLFAAFAFAERGLAAKEVAVDAEKILEAAEAIRNPTEQYVCQVELQDRDKGEVDKRTYRVEIKDRDRARVTFLTPATEQGGQVLMVGEMMWLRLPDQSKAMTIAARQRLTGNAVYGDITRINFSKNYSAKFLRKDTLEGRKMNVLELTAIEGKQVTYDVIEYWLDAKTNQPIKALYKSDSGKALREGYFDDYRKVLGVKRPSTFRIVDFLKKNHVTTLTFSAYKKAKLDDALFRKENLGRDSL